MATLGDVVPGILPMATSGGGVTYEPDHYNTTEQGTTMHVNVKKLAGGDLILKVPVDGALVIDVKRLIWSTLHISSSDSSSATCCWITATSG